MILVVYITTSISKCRFSKSDPQCWHGFRSGQLIYCVQAVAGFLLATAQFSVLCRVRNEGLHLSVLQVSGILCSTVQS